MSLPPPDVMPAEITYGYVMGRYLLAVGDGPDEGRLPDARPATGMTVTLTPATVMHRGSTPPTTVLRAPTPCEVGPDGYLRERDVADGTTGDEEPGGPPPGVWLITGVYKVTFGGLASHALPKGFDVEVTTSHTEASPLWLPEAEPYIPPAGHVVQVVPLSGASATTLPPGSAATASITDGTLVVGVPVGDPGPAGQDGAAGADGRGIVSVADADGDGVATVTYTDGATDTLALPAGPKGDPGDPADSTGAAAGTVLTADGAGGSSWAAPSGGGAPRFGVVPVLGPTVRVGGGGGARAWVPLNPHFATEVAQGRVGNAVGDLSGLPLSLPRDLVHASHVIRVATAEADATLRWGLYGVDADGMPTGMPVLDSGTISLSASGDIVTNQAGAVPAGDYWLLAVMSSPADVARVRGWTTPWQMSLQGSTPTGPGNAYQFGTATAASPLPDVSARSATRTNFGGRAAIAVLIGGAP